MKQKESQVTIVIPTRNRMFSLNRLLYSISKQTYLPKEIIIVDSSDEKLTTSQFILPIQLEIKIIHSTPSVCLQRNIGIEECNTDFIFLCDDDIEISENYIENLVKFLEENPSVNITSGLIYEKRKDKWNYSEKKISFLKLVFNYIFGLSVWSDVRNEDYSKNKIVQKFISFYLKKGNRIAKSGWPIVVDYKFPVFKTPIYSLMSSLVRANLMKKNLYDLVFYENGIGDNYDVLVAMNNNITIISDQKVYHHEEKINRLKNENAYYYRISALHYILLKHKKFTIINILFLLWSLIGNSIIFTIKGKIRMLILNFKLITRIIFNANIYN